MSDPPVPPDLEEYTGYKLVGVAIAFTVLEVTFVALRFVARSLGNVKFAIDDALMLPGLVFCIAINTCAIGLTRLQSSKYN